MNFVTDLLAHARRSCEVFPLLHQVRANATIRIKLYCDELRPYRTERGTREPDPYTTYMTVGWVRL